MIISFGVIIIIIIRHEFETTNCNELRTNKLRWWALYNERWGVE